jgi:hypothetical protein
MRDRAGSHDGPLDRHAPVDQGIEVPGVVVTQVLGLDEGVKCTAVGDIVAHGSQAGNIAVLIQGQHECGHVVEENAFDPPPSRRAWAVTRPAGASMRTVVTGSTASIMPVSMATVVTADDPVAAHGTVSLVVQEQDAEIRFGRHRRRDDAAVHVGMPPGLPHQRRAQVVQAVGHEAPARQDGVAFQVPAGRR